MQTKLYTVAAVVAMIALAFAACDNGGGGGTPGGEPAKPEPARPFNDITAAELVSNIRVGWNLGNTLEAYDHGDGWLPPTSTVKEMEEAWVHHTTTKANIDAIKNAGFNAIRIPVTWTKATSGAPNYTIRTDWMNRVKQLVGYALDNDMYVLLNTHHDEEYVFDFQGPGVAAGQEAFRKLWDQIAKAFKDYDERLVFEALNEPRTVDSPTEWTGGTATERANLNTYYQIFVDTVRASSGNNNKRILQINTYASRFEAPAVDGLTLPTDTVPNKLIVNFHMYEPNPFCYNFPGNVPTWSASSAADKAPITQAMDRFYSKYIQNGIPVIIGECGAQYKNNNPAREAWAEFYFGYAWSKGIKCFIFDNNIFEMGEGDAGEAFGLFKRENNTFPFPGIKDAIMRATRD